MANKLIFMQTEQMYKGVIKSINLHREVTVHTLWFDGETTQRKMPLFEALEFQARHVGDVKAITIF